MKEGPWNVAGVRAGNVRVSGSQRGRYGSVRVQARNGNGGRETGRKKSGVWGVGG